MSGHYPFSGRANRIGVYAFFEKLGLSLELQERYYKWWYDWAKNFVSKDPDLSYSKGVEFNHYPYGQHAHENFHLHDYMWATALLDLGQFIEHNIFPRLSEKDLHKLEQDHHHLMDQLGAERAKSPRPEPPEVGRYRHV